MNQSQTVQELSEELQARAQVLEAYLSKLYEDKNCPPSLQQAVRYSLLAGGKRLRPILWLAATEACLPPDQAQAHKQEAAQKRADLLAASLAGAAALEMIHTYSLIHDDLPAMDDDDLRRGRPSNHKVYGEATAILAGDALLTDAFALLASCASNSALEPAKLLAALRELALAAGSCGMVGGQILDMQAEGQALSLPQLAEMNAKKTGALIRAACLCGGLMAGADQARLQALQEYGQALGLAFQITDDILDVSGSAELMGKNPGQDAKHAKASWPGLLGLEQARNMALEQSAKAVAALDPELFPGPAGNFLRALPPYLQKRLS